MKFISAAHRVTNRSVYGSQTIADNRPSATFMHKRKLVKTKPTIQNDYYRRYDTVYVKTNKRPTSPNFRGITNFSWTSFVLQTYEQIQHNLYLLTEVWHQYGRQVKGSEATLLIAIRNFTVQIYACVVLCFFVWPNDLNIVPPKY